MRIGFKLVLAGIVIIGLAGGAVLGMSHLGAKTSQASAAGQPVSFFAANSALGAQGGTASVDPVTVGVVDTVGQQQFTVKSNASPDPVAVRVTDQTTIRKQATGAITDLKKGDRVLARGTAAADGTINAVSLQFGVTDMAAAAGAGPGATSGAGGRGAFGQGRQTGSTAGAGGNSGQFRRGGAGNGFGNSGTATTGAGNAQVRQAAAANGANGNGAQSSDVSVIFGTVQSVDGNVVTILRQAAFQGTGAAQTQASNGPVKVNVSNRTIISTTVDGTFQDIKPGTTVTVRGPSGTDRVVAASSIQIVPADAVQRFRQGPQQ